MTITPQQVQEIQDRLKQWKAERHLTVEISRAGLIGNLLEELTELERSDTIYEYIDALMDISVFCINAMSRDFITEPDLTLPYPAGQLSDLIQDVAKLSKLMTDGILIKADTNDNTYPYYQKTVHQALTNLVKRCWAISVRCNIDPIKAMDETIKEISSRTGHFDPQINKFIKDTSPEAKAKWYKADYTKAEMN